MNYIDFLLSVVLHYIHCIAWCRLPYRSSGCDPAFKRAAEIEPIYIVSGHVVSYRFVLYWEE